MNNPKPNLSDITAIHQMLTEVLLENRELTKELSKTCDNAARYFSECRTASLHIAELQGELSKLQLIADELASERNSLLERSERE